MFIGVNKCGSVVKLVCSIDKTCTGMQYAKHSASMPLAVRFEPSGEARHMLAVAFLAVMTNARVVSADG